MMTRTRKKSSDKSLRHGNKILIGSFLAVLFFSFASPAAAASDVAKLWSGHRQTSSVLFYNTQGLDDFIYFLVYLAAACGAVMGLMMVYVGRIKIHLAGKGEDALEKASSAYVSGFVVFLVSSAIYVSLDEVIPIIRKLSESIV